MIRISQLKLKVGHTRDELFEAIVHQAHGKRPLSWHIVRKSVDARKKPQLFYVYTIDAEFENEKKLLSAKKSKWTRPSIVKYTFPYKNEGKLQTGSSDISETADRPVIVGMGPAGLFAALVLARGGFAPVVFERGDCVEVRSEIVEHFFESGELDEESNVQFGEGGAGTFSDGKLNTLVKDKFGRNHFVLKEFVKHGAPEDILYEAKPHIGTDILKDVVVSVRKEIESLGGEIHFRTKVCDIICENNKSESNEKEDKGTGSLKTDLEGNAKEKNMFFDGTESQIKGLILDRKGVRTEYLCHNVIFAIGHSARDTFYMLHKRELSMTPKAFAIGVRVEHPANIINESQYGQGYPQELPTASYKLTHQCESTGRGIYSFCMCPGGYVVNSSSEKGRLCVNGMSYHDRAGRNSNTALITTVTPDDFPSDSPLSGLEFQRKYEELAYKAGSGKIPVQLFGDFLKNQPSTKLGDVIPAIKGEWKFANLHDCLPDYICTSLAEGMKAFGHKIKGYDAEDAVFSGVETRTSSPVRMERDKQFESNIKGLFPCGEGAGYAGGITSAAMDGIKTAEAIAEKILSQR